MISLLKSSAKWHTFLDSLAEQAYGRCMSTLTESAKTINSKRPAGRGAAGVKRRGSSLGLKASDTPSLIRQMEEGLSVHALHRLVSHTGLSLALLASIIGIPERTLARRKAIGKLSPEESERLLRVSSIFEKSMELFEGDLAAAINWLTTPKKALGNQQPLLYLRTELGAREVEDLIGRLEHGVFS